MSGGVVAARAVAVCPPGRVLPYALASPRGMMASNRLLSHIRTAKCPSVPVPILIIS